MIRLRGTLLAGAFAATACVQSGTEAGEANDPDPPPPGPPECRSSTATDPLATFGGGRCGWELVDSGGAVVLQSLATEPPPSSTGTAPEVCARRPCTFEGHDTAAGPVVIIRVVAAGSEMPEGVWLGFGAGERLGFVNLWDDAGPDVYGDGTRLGPTHALAPHQCGKQLALLVKPRTNAGMDVDPPPQLAQRAGVYAVETDGVKRVSDAPAKGCLPLRVPLP